MVQFVLQRVAAYRNKAVKYSFKQMSVQPFHCGAEKIFDSKVVMVLDASLTETTASAKSCIKKLTQIRKIFKDDTRSSLKKLLPQFGSITQLFTSFLCDRQYLFKLTTYPDNTC